MTQIYKIGSWRTTLELYAKLKEVAEDAEWVIIDPKTGTKRVVEHPESDKEVDIS